MKSHPCVKTPGGGVSPSSETVFQSPTSNPPTSESAESALQLPTFQPPTSELAPPTSESTESAFQPPTFQPLTSVPCRHINRRGHRCRLFSTIPNLELCPHHARLLEKQHQRHNDNTASELLGDLTDFSTPDAVNALLGNLVRQLARKRIARLDAIAIAYVSQLLLGSIAALDRRDALAERAAANDDLPPRIIFDNPLYPEDSAQRVYPEDSARRPDLDPPAPTSDTARIAALFNSAPESDTQNTEGRA